LGGDLGRQNGDDPGPTDGPAAERRGRTTMSSRFGVGRRKRTIAAYGNNCHRFYSYLARPFTYSHGQIYYDLCISDTPRALRRTSGQPCPRKGRKHRSPAWRESLVRGVGGIGPWPPGGWRWGRKRRAGSGSPGREEGLAKWRISFESFAGSISNFFPAGGAVLAPLISGALGLALGSIRNGYFFRGPWDPRWKSEEKKTSQGKVPLVPPGLLRDAFPPLSKKAKKKRRPSKKVSGGWSPPSLFRGNFSGADRTGLWSVQVFFLCPARFRFPGFAPWPC